MNKTKKAIVDAAIKEFSCNGFTGASVDQIAVTAGVAKGTLYYHFTSKEEIFNFIIQYGMELLTSEVDLVIKKETDLVEALREMCIIQLRIVHENKDFFKVVMSQLWGQELRQFHLRDILRTYISHIDERLKLAMSHNIVKKSNNSYMSYFVFGTICSTAIFEILNGNSDINGVVEDMMDYLLNGICG